MREDLRINVTKLTNDFSNWVTHRDRMLWALALRGLSEHLMSASVTQGYLNAGDIGGFRSEPRWWFDQAVVKQLVAASISNTVFNRIKGETSANHVWEELKTIFEGDYKTLNMGTMMMSEHWHTRTAS
jgi:hypothetical protein